MLRLLPYLLLLLLLGARPAQAQAVAGAAADSLQARYPFLRLAANHIENAPIGLQRFYQHLFDLPLHPAALPGGRVSIVHIGDSHLQADEYSGRVRQELQRRYGNAGRGLAFPFRLAKTNGSPTFRTTVTGGIWRSKRVLTKPDTTLPVGVSGISLATVDTNAAFTLRIPLLLRPDYRFNKLTLLREPGPTAFDWQVVENHNRQLGIFAGNTGSIAEPLRLDSLRNFVGLRAVRTSPRQTNARLYGLLLDNGQPGIFYHAIGVNGAAISQYNRAPRFFAQLPLLQPDLFIISLGTNDAYAVGFDTAVFARQLDTLITRLRRQCPRADVLLAAPPDSYRARRHRNPDLGRLAGVMRTYAQAHDLAYYDFGAVQGGYGSMSQWRAAGLAQADLVHFTAPGYDLQGLLLYLAIQDGFAAFRAR